jgi:hypothetical protein
MANTCECSINIVIENKPKVLRGLCQNGNGVGTRRFPCLVRGNMTPGGQNTPNPFVVIETEHGNPVRLPKGKASRKANPRACGNGRMEEAKAIL